METYILNFSDLNPDDWEFLATLPETTNLLFVPDSDGRMPCALLPYLLRLKAIPEFLPTDIPMDNIAGFSFMLAYRCSQMDQGDLYFITNNKNYASLDGYECEANNGIIQIHVQKHLNKPAPSKNKKIITAAVSKDSSSNQSPASDDEESQQNTLVNDKPNEIVTEADSHSLPLKYLSRVNDIDKTGLVSEYAMQLASILTEAEDENPIAIKLSLINELGDSIGEQVFNQVKEYLDDLQDALE